MLTEGLWRPDLRRSWVVGEVRRWVVAGLAEVGRNGVAPGPWTPWIGVGCSCSGGGRVSATGAKPAASNFPNLSSPSTAGSGKIPALAGLGPGEDELGEAPGAGAKRLWGLAGAMAWPSCWCSGARRGCALGFVVAAEEGRRV